jgi:DNA recombination protein Rad52
MTFAPSQLRKLRAKIKPHHIKARQAEGMTLHYLEGWHVVAEANRIFGFDGWDREMAASQCVWTKQLGSRFAAAYVARVRITVRAGETRIIREGSGAGEAASPTPGHAHELAAKAAETDATKRALSTFGNAFGLSLYAGIEPEPFQHPRNAAARLDSNGATSPPNSALASGLPQAGPVTSIDKTALAVSEPKRLREPEHLQYVASQPCIICGRAPSQAHHLTFTQPHALGRKVSDEFTIPLCNIHHRELHDHGNEHSWWHEKKINPLPRAGDLWAESHGWPAKAAAASADLSSETSKRNGQ